MGVLIFLVLAVIGSTGNFMFSSDKIASENTLLYHGQNLWSCFTGKQLFQVFIQGLIGKWNWFSIVDDGNHNVNLVCKGLINI